MKQDMKQGLVNKMKQVIKTNNFKTALLLSTLLVSAVINSSCSKSSSSNPAVAVPGTVTGGNAIDITSGTTLTYGSGSTSVFKPVNFDTMNKYASVPPYYGVLNNPSNFAINLNLTSVGQGRFGGTVSISYLDNGIQHNAELKAGTGVNSSYKGLYDNGVLESNYNYWYSYNNQLVFSAYFQDQYGAITVTLVPQTSATTTGNDAEPIPTGPYKGYVYFKNFTLTTASQYQRSCWFTYTGPYDCRSNVISTKGGYFPGPETGYQLLGTFTDVNVSTAFNLQ